MSKEKLSYTYLPNIKIGEKVNIEKDSVFEGYGGIFKGWYYRYNQGWRCKVKIEDIDIEFLPEQLCW